MSYFSLRVCWRLKPSEFPQESLENEVNIMSLGSPGTKGAQQIWGTLVSEGQHPTKESAEASSHRGVFRAPWPWHQLTSWVFLCAKHPSTKGMTIWTNASICIWSTCPVAASLRSGQAKCCRSFAIFWVSWDLTRLKKSDFQTPSWGRFFAGLKLAPRGYQLM